MARSAASAASAACWKLGRAGLARSRESTGSTFVSDESTRPRRLTAGARVKLKGSSLAVIGDRSGLTPAVELVLGIDERVLRRAAWKVGGDRDAGSMRDLVRLGLVLLLADKKQLGEIEKRLVGELGDARRTKLVRIRSHASNLQRTTPSALSSRSCEIGE